MRTIWYMGAKTRLAGDIQAAIGRAAPSAGCALDLMSGTGAVAQALAGRGDLRVVANDVQRYAAAIARARLVHPVDPTRVADALDPQVDLGRAYHDNARALLEPLADAVALEDAFLLASGLAPETPDPEVGALFPLPSDPARLRRAQRHVPRDPRERARAYRAFALQGTPRFQEGREAPPEGGFAGVFRPARALYSAATVEARRRDPWLRPWLLSSVYWPNVYLGLRQAIALDSLRGAIEALPARDALARQKRELWLAALLHALSVTTSATSHFCQPRGLSSDAEVQAVQERRAVSLCSRTFAYARELAEAAAAAPRRADHAVFACDWRALYARHWDQVAADVVYVDPPYTADNYSRFYHVLEVVTAWDHPPLQNGGATKGRYPARETRHRSPFCVRGQVERELAAVVEETARRGAALVLSYGEENGLLLRRWREGGLSAAEARARFQALAGAGYRQVELVERALLHSGQGDSNHRVTELLLVARAPRSGGVGRKGRSSCA